MAITINIANATDDSNAYATTLLEASCNGVCFSADGAKMYVSGTASNRIYQVDLSTPWDVSTGVYNSVFLSVLNPEDVTIASDGTYIFEIGSGFVRSYLMSTPWDLSTASFVASNAVVSNTYGGCISEDGAKLFLTRTSGTPGVYRYDMSTPYDVSTLAVHSSYDTTPDGSTSSRGVFIKDDHVFVASNTLDAIMQYSTTGLDASTMTLVSTMSMTVYGLGGSNPIGLYLKSDDLTKVYVLVSDAVRQASTYARSWQTQSSVMTIDETSIYSDVLTPAEVANLYHSYLTSGSGSQLLEDTSNDTHGLSYSFDFVSGTDYTLTISAKALTRDYIHLSLPASAFGTEQRAAFNLSAGTSASESGSPTIAMTSTGDGWYRCSISATATTTATASFNYYASDGTLTYTGNGYYGIGVNFAQLEDNSSFTTYEKDGLSQETQVETIGAVPGTGQLLGIHYYNDTVYVFRNAADNATAVMWASSANGWTSKKTGLTPNGKYRCVNYAFGTTQKMYIVSGVHKAAEWDGTTWTDITTGMSPDTPEHVIGHKKHLFLAFGNSVQHSPLGDPTGTWSVLTGASEMVLPYDVTGFSTLSNGSLGIFSREGIIQLAGTSSSDWVANNMTEYSNNAGAKPDTIQSMGNKMFFLDSRGITELGASDTSSDFYDSLISHAVDNRFRDKWANAICSCVVREKGQYRLFFNDGSGLIMTVVNNQIMFTELELPHRIQCVVSSEDSDGDEVIYFGSDDGYVRQMEKGKHFDIDNIICSVETAPFNCGHKGYVKRFRRLKFDTSTVGTSSLSVTPIFNLDNTGAPTTTTPDYLGSGSLLGSSLLGTSLLGAGLVREGDMDLEDHGEWIRLLFSSADNDQFQWEVDGYTVDYLLGRKRR